MHRKSSLSAIFFAFFLLMAGAPVMAANADQNIQAGTAAFQGGDFAKAAQFFSSAAEELAKAKNPQAVLLYGNAALALMKGQNYQGAADLYERLINGKFNVPQDKLLQYYVNSVVCYTKLKQSGMQIAAIDRLLKKFPKLKPADVAELYASEGDAYFRMELYPPAIACYERALAKLPANENLAMRARIMGALGESQRNLGAYPQAIKSLTQAQELAAKLNDPKIVAEAKSKLGILHTEIGDYPEAMKRLQDALATDRKAKLRLHEGSDLNNIGQVHLYTGNHEKAMEHFEQGIAIAKEVGNTKGQAVATVNRALLNRITGALNQAREDYKEAARLFKECGMEEGQAVTMLGIGKMAELADKNNVEALENYTNALAAFQKLQHPRWQAITLLQLGDLHKKFNSPKGRATRDLVFDEEPTNPDISPAEAISKSREFYAQALKLGEQLHADEIVWAAHQGLGYSDYTEGKLEEALKHYQQAIDLVSRMFVTLQDVQMLGEYMAGKEELYNEAIEVCSKLYDKTKDKKYLDLITRYRQTLNNEINKANTTLVKLNFEDKAKQQLYERILAKGKAKNQAAKSIPAIADAPADASADVRMTNALVKKVANDQKVQVQKLDGEYSKLLAEWQKKYPEDADIFTSSANRVNVPEIQKALQPGQAVLQYIPLKGNKDESGKLLIIGIKKDATETFSVNVDEKTLRKLIIDDFVVGYVHDGFKRIQRDENGTVLLDSKKHPIMGAVNYPRKARVNNKEYFDKSLAVLQQLYAYLMPSEVQNFLSGVQRIYFIVDGFLSQIPFTMLICGRENDGLPIYLVEKYEISTVRPSFIKTILTQKSKGRIKKMLAVANPNNENFPMGFLEGSISEIATANKMLEPGVKDEKDIALEPYRGNMFKPTDISSSIVQQFPDYPEVTKSDHRPTEKWLRENLASNKYEIIYFATHGQAQSDTFTKIESQLKTAQGDRDIAAQTSAQKAINKRQFKALKTMRDKNLAEPTPLNGFLYLSNLPEDQVLDKDLQPIEGYIPKERDGLFTIGEILELDREKFDNTKYVLLSACNAAVSLVPFAIGEEYEETAFFDPETVKRDLSKWGFLDGVDQVTFVESFMKKGIENVFASYWQLDDTAAEDIMGRFWKELQNQKDNPDLIKAYSLAQKKYLEAAKAKMRKEKDLDDMHPYYWAAGGMFGK